MPRVALLGLTSFVFTLLILSSSTTTATHSGTDYINFQASTIGNDFDGDGKREWCWSQYWHPTNALDLVPQTGPTNCPSVSTEWVHLAQHGWTTKTTCWVSAPCRSIHVWEIDLVDQDTDCDYIDVQTYDWNYQNYWKGTLKLFHATNPWASGENLSLNVAHGTYYQEFTIGTVVGDWDCTEGFTNYHVHQAFWPAACTWNLNGGLGVGDKNWEKPNPNHWIQKYSHNYLHPC